MGSVKKTGFYRRITGVCCLWQASALIASSLSIGSGQAWAGPVHSPTRQTETTVASLGYADLLTLADCETKIYGGPHKNLPSEDRVSALESAVYGEAKKGDLSARVAALKTALVANKGGLLAPPMVAQMDQSGQNQKPASNGRSPSPSYAEEDPQADMPPKAPVIDRTKVSLRQALDLYSQGKVDQAEAAFRQVLNLDRNNVDANYNLGAIEEGRGNYQAALNYYKVAQRQSPDDNEISSAVTSVQNKLMKGDGKTAYLPPPEGKSYGSNGSGYSPPAASAPPLDPQKRIQLKGKVSQAAAAFKSGDYDTSTRILEEVAREAPSEADVQYALSQSYKAKGRYLDARTSLNAAVSLAPDNQLYQDARRDLDRLIANGGAHGTNSGRADDTIANSYQPDQSSSGGKAGEITPFTGAGAPNSAVGWQSTGGNYSGSNYRPYDKSSRIQRAAIGGLTGAAMGAALGGVFGGYGYRSRSMMTGAAIGGLFGILRGF